MYEILIQYKLNIELRFIHQEMGLLRAENHKQNAEITSLKETVQSQNKTIHQHETVIKELITFERKRRNGKSAGNHRRNPTGPTSPKLCPISRPQK